ncbi:hypothetical protein F5879DRAFT_937154 [Lentinula edodes]|nr:hypothetical protein F5879DRAFT_937154 [Lentinula edodes]
MYLGLAFLCLLCTVSMANYAHSACLNIIENGQISTFRDYEIHLQQNQEALSGRKRALTGASTGARNPHRPYKRPLLS